jgi:hypothetical protein
MSTITRETKKNLIDWLADELDGIAPSVSVVDAKQLANVELPTLAVDITSSAAHSIAIPGTMRLGVEIVLRAHSGDHNDDEIENLIDDIESLLFDPSAIKYHLHDGIQIDHWFYNGSEEDWDESIIEVTFDAEALVRGTE